ncbi:hypothetical protein GPECTOR_1g813 [Gonium pectorale]|uniref:Ankyrin repeat domain-containing protein n=1 Tax=Gonium pectorale TaxID=33097 RepID=A0A150H4C0_GONPE|nr:hypothetical protein GPECTOR_1g813 [Gonium pectorale]|eukprot:KXZ56902.1 hypothetical protein GPECTOR_1g813 [Gonium pectorale]
MADGSGACSLAAAARAGHVHVCEWLLANGCPWGVHAAGEAAMGGHSGLMQLLLDRCPDAARLRDTELRGLMLAAVALGCDLATLHCLHGRWMDQEAHIQPGPADAAAAPPPPYQELSPQIKAKVVAAAAGSATPDWQAKLEWLEGRGYERCAAACERAASRVADGAERLAWLRDRGYPVGPEATSVAASAGNLAALRYLLAHGVRPGEAATRAAAAEGQLETLVVLTAAGCAMDDVALLLAAYNGHLHVVAWLVEALGPAVLQAPAAALLFAVAANGGSLELLAWLRDRGCPWGDASFVAAAGAGWVEALEWLADRGCPLPTGGGAFVAAGFNSDFATLRCLRRIGVPWGACGLAFTEAVYSEMRCQGCSRQVLDWMLAEGCPVDWERALAAAGQRRAGQGAAASAMAEWLAVQRDAGRGTVRGDAWDAAARRRPGGGRSGSRSGSRSGGGAVFSGGGDSGDDSSGLGGCGWVRRLGRLGRLGALFGGGCCFGSAAARGEPP